MSYRITFHDMVDDDLSEDNVRKTIAIFPLHDTARFRQIEQTFGIDIHAPVGGYLRVYESENGHIGYAHSPNGYDLRKTP